MREMFCFQCQQTANNTGCDGKAGVCGKKADTANYQDELIGALIGLARAARAGTPTPHTDELILKGLFTTITNVNFNNETILQCKAEIEKEKAAVGPGQLDDYDLAALWAAGEDVRSLKSLILFGLKGMAAYAYHARALGRTDPAVNAFFYEALEAIGAEKTPDELLALVLVLCAAMAVGVAVCYVFGTVWFMVLSGNSLWVSLSYCVLPFLPGDVLKILLAALLTGRLKKAMWR